MPLVPLVSQSARDDDAGFAATSRLVNCYRETGTEGQTIKQTLGMQAFATLGDVFLRAMHPLNGSIYAVCGGNLYRVTSAGEKDLIGAVASGNASTATNYGKLCVAAGGQYFVVSGTTLAEVTGYDFDTNGIGSVCTVGGFTVLTEEGGKRFTWSDAGDPTTVDARFNTADGGEDNIIRAASINGNLIIFKEQSREVWTFSGSSVIDDVFVRAAGGVVDTGLKSFGLFCEVENTAFFVGDDGRAYLTDGYTQRAVSTRPVETSLRYSRPAWCLTYEDEGHTFACIVFEDRAAWCYDVSADEWHERETVDRWPVVASVKFNGEWFVGTETGVISQLLRNGHDNGAPMASRIVSQELYNDAARFRIAELEIYPRVGVTWPTVTLNVLGSPTGAFTDDTGAVLLFAEGRAQEPVQLQVRFSQDRGETWGAGRLTELGSAGEYGQRVVWRALGQYRSVTAEITWSGVADVSFKNAARLRLA